MFVTLAVNVTLPPAATGAPSIEMLSTRKFMPACAANGNATNAARQTRPAANGFFIVVPPELANYAMPLKLLLRACDHGRPAFIAESCCTPCRNIGVRHGFPTGYRW